MKLTGAMADRAAGHLPSADRTASQLGDLLVCLASAGFVSSLVRSAISDAWVEERVADVDREVGKEHEGGVEDDQT